MAASARRYLKHPLHGQLRWNIEGQKEDIFEIVGLEVFKENFLLWLKLKEFEEEAHEVSGFVVAVDATDGIEFDGSINNRDRYEGLTAQSVRYMGKLFATNQSMRNSAPSSTGLHRFGCG